MKQFNYIFLLMALSLATQAMQAQDDTVKVRLVTFYPGSEIFEIYGHSEIRVTWDGNDWYFNYGVFDFNEPHFAYHFVTGEAEYMCAAMPRQWATMGMDGRRMIEQELNLTPQQAIQVRNFLINSALPQNCKYQYKYLGDNCSTRARDVIEMAVGSTLRYPTTTNTVTYRDIMSHYARNYAWDQFGIDLVLGSDLDKPIDVRQHMFIPMALMNAIDSATIERNGRRVSLVRSRQVVVDGSEEGTVLPATPWYLHPLTAAIALLALTVVITIADLRRHRVTRWLDFGIATVYSMAGSLIFFLMFVSEREATCPNYNALWLNPFYIIALTLMCSKRTRKALKVYHVANGILVASTIVMWPLLPQTMNPAFLPLMIIPVLRALAHVRAQ